MLQPEILTKEQAILPFFRLAFRPFFLLPALCSILAISLWVSVLSGEYHWAGALPVNIWHGREMVFGFSATIAIGFLLTAAQTWTGVRSLHGWKLAGVVLLWLTARYALFSDSVFLQYLGMICEALWWGTCISYLGYMVIKSNNRKNLIFVPLLTIMMILDLSNLLSAFTGKIALAIHLTYAAVIMMTTVVTVIGGRVIPFFTIRTLALPVMQGNKILERIIALMMALTLLSFVSSYFFAIEELTASLFIATGGAQILRMASWQTLKTFQKSLLWSLHLSYFNMGIGFIVIGLSYFITELNFSSAMHIVTIGTFGTMIIAMMSRVSLGHTGRTLCANSWISFSFLLLLNSMLFRVFLPTMGWIKIGYNVAAISWCLGFIIYLVNYGPMLLKSRPDGRSG